MTPAKTFLFVVMVATAMLLGTHALPADFSLIQERCQSNRTAIFAHAGQCQLYYDCSQDGAPWSRHFHQYLQECPYPQLFSTVSLRCEPFELVDCGDRVEHVDQCQYLRSRCGSAHCRPCWVWAPSCQGLPDGMNEHPVRKESPHYIVCRSNRTVSTDQCLRHPVLDVPQYFFAPERRCIPLNEFQQRMSNP